MKRVVWILLVVVLVLGVGGFGAFRAVQSRSAVQKPAPGTTAKVERGDLLVQVVETGTIDAVKSVEVKSRVQGRLARLLVDEGDQVQQGQLIAVIDPKETQLRVEQDQAQLRGAQANAERIAIEIEQRRVTARAARDRAVARIAQLRKELQAQPILTRTSITSAQTALASAVQARDQLVATTQPNERTNAQSAVDEARASYDNALSELNRRRDLERQGFVAGREVETAQLQVDLAQTRLRAATDRLNRLAEQQRIERDQAEQRIRQLRADVERAQAGRVQDDVKARELDSAIATLREAEAQLRDVDALQKSRQQGLATVQQINSALGESMRQLGETEIRAPITGIVSRRMMQEGELVASLSSFSAGSPIVRIEDRRALRVMLNINEIDVAKLRVGMAAQIAVDAIPDTTFKGEVRKISPASQGATGTGATASADAVVRYAVEIWLTEPDERLRTGMSARCTVDVVRREKVLRVPIEFVGRDGEQRFVQIALPTPPGQKQKSERRNVRVGLTTGAFAEILEGVKEGDELVKPPFTGPRRAGMMEVRTGDD